MSELLGFGGLIIACGGFVTMSLFYERLGLILFHIGFFMILGGYYTYDNSLLTIILCILAVYVVYVMIGLFVRLVIRNDNLIEWSLSYRNNSTIFFDDFKRRYAVKSFNKALHHKYASDVRHHLYGYIGPMPIVFIFFCPIYLFQFKWKTVKRALSINYNQLLKETEECIISGKQND